LSGLRPIQVDRTSLLAQTFEVCEFQLKLHLAIDVLATADGEHHNRVARVLDVADEAIGSDSLPPEAFLFSVQSLSEPAGILSLLHMLS